MKKAAVLFLLVAAAAGGAWLYYSGALDTAAVSAQPGGGAGRAGRAGGAGSGRGGTALTVDTAIASRHDIVEYITVVGNLIGEATVDVVPRVAGRLESISVKLGDRVAKGQQVAKMEALEIREQVNQAAANLDVNKATVAQRESDRKVADTTLARTKASYDRGLTTKQNLEDAEARFNSTLAQVDVARAQAAQTQARIDELKITLGNTTIVSPVDGFVGKRNLDQGAFAGANTPVLSVVDISTVRLVANLIEKDFRRVQEGAGALVEVDAFPGEKFTGQVSRVAPVFDPATRTATMEIEVPNPGFRLKPGMYARVQLVADHREGTLTVPRNAVVDLDGKRGVYLVDGPVARFREVHSGLQDADYLEVLDGLDEGARVVTTGALALRDGDRITLAGAGRDAKPGSEKGRSSGPATTGR